MIIDSTDGSADAGDNLLLEDAYDAGNILNEVAFRKVTAESEMNREVEMDLNISNSIYYRDVTAYDRYLYYEDAVEGVILDEDGDKILAEIPNEFQNSEFDSSKIIPSIIEYLQLLLE